MRHPLKIVTLVLLMMIAGAVTTRAQEVGAETSAAVDSSSSEAAPSPGQGGKQRDTPYMMKRGDNEFGFWGAVGFKATTIFGGLHEDEAQDRRFFLAAFRYGRTLAATRRLAWQYTLDAIPVA